MGKFSLNLPPEKLVEYHRFLTLAVVFFGCLAVLAWRVTGDPLWVSSFFEKPAAVFLVYCPIMELLFAVTCFQAFTKGEAVKSAWMLLSISAAARVLGGVLVQAVGWRDLGFVVNGPVSLTVLLLGLRIVLLTYRRLGIRPRFGWFDAGLMVFCLLHTGNHLRMVAENLTSASFRFHLLPVLNWFTDPLLCLLLAHALLLRRAALTMGGGMIGSGWSSYAVGTFLTALGDLGIWIAALEILPTPFEALTWLVWVPAAGWFSMGPAYAWAAIRSAFEARQTQGLHP